MDAAPTQLPLDLPPMEAESVDELPSGVGWQYEPKYDGFRCLAHRHGKRVHLQSKSPKPL
jgi:ATP-dependent DNA ligase